MTTTPRRLLAMLLTALLLLAACGDSDDDGGDSSEAAADTELRDESSDAPAETEAPAADAGETVEIETADEAGDGDAAEGAPPTDDQVGGPGVVPAAVTAADFGRDIVYTANVDLEVDDVAIASQQAVAAIGALGGVVFGQDATNDPAPRAVFTFKVPPAQFQDALAALADLGVPRSQTVSADDVTERVVDLRSRISTSEASVDRLRALLEQAGDLDAIARLEGQLLERETALEQLRGQLRTLEDQVSLATIVAVFSASVPSPALELTQTGELGSLDEVACPGTDDLAVDEGDELVLCATVVNTGDTMLAGLAITDDAFDIDASDVTVVEGDLEEALAPGERVIVAYAITAEPGRSSTVRVTAEPTDAAGNPLREAIQAEGDRIDLSVEASDALPGFRDALDGGLGVLTAAIGVVVLIAGAVLPFVWLVPVVWLAVRFRNNRREAPGGEQAPPAPEPA